MNLQKNTPRQMVDEKSYKVLSSDVVLKAEAVLQNARDLRLRASENQKRTTHRRCTKNMKRIIPTREDSIQSDIAVIQPKRGRILTVLKEDEYLRNTRVDSNLATFERLPDLTGDYKSKRRTKILKKRNGRIAKLRQELESGALDSVFKQLDQLKLEPNKSSRQRRRVSWSPELFDEVDENSLCSEPTLRTKRSIKSILRSP